ncbi:MAG: peptidoglycan DD-metalloendopeptidase family protein [Thermoanaerobaculaceae bacterium]|nr:peptidoglycan DD-metalloendopeptidase family protein [Thermoanaerobaculaceae bacterium]MDI9622498.1 M23 family metallopeptidase [Acidobacteriota bacterium]NLH12015.1 peptidoglycan DD-metalloendopeptidase family protein [Holophagae bacterium]HPW56176.1 M23 family metallopeptidase [Thermoanaerobaculaceae bacterium]
MAEKRHSTIIIVPHAHGKVYKLHLSPRVLKALVALGIVTGLLTLVSLAGSSSFIQQRAVYKALQRENKQLKKANQRLSETVTQVQGRLSQFEQRTKSLALAAGIPDLLVAQLDAPRGAAGSGGPSNPLDTAPEALVRRQEALDRQIAQVEQKLSEQAVMISHTPVLAPVVGVITDGFGPRIHPITLQPDFHEGLDISAAIGTPVLAPADGVVVFADRESGFGKLIKISHGYGFTTLYGHLDRFEVKSGQKVARGQVIGKVGLTGRSTGSHLHYEVWKDGEKQNPLHYILDAY